MHIRDLPGALLFAAFLLICTSLSAEACGLELDEPLHVNCSFCE